MQGTPAHKDEIDRLIASLAATPTRPPQATGPPPPPVNMSPNPASFKQPVTSPRAPPVFRNGLDDLVRDLSGQLAPSVKGKCWKCGNDIFSAVDTINTGTHLYHSDHFTCNRCSIPLGTKAYYMLGGLPYCEPCHMILVPRHQAEFRVPSNHYSQ